MTSPNLDLLSPSNRVREVAARALAADRPDHPTLWRLLAEDPAWAVRVVAAQVLPLSSALYEVALDDPHWRIRATVIRRLDTATETQRTDLQGLAATGPQRAGALAFLAWRWRGAPADWSPPHAVEAPRPAFWSTDPAVLEWRVRTVNLRQHRDIIPELCEHDRPSVRTTAIKALGRWGSPEDLRRLADHAQDSRRPHVLASVKQLLPKLDSGRYLPMIQALLETGGLPACAAIESMDPDSLTRFKPDLLRLSQTEGSAQYAAARGLDSSLPIPPSVGKQGRVIGPEGPVQQSIASHTSTSRMGVSGHYGLPQRGYEIALERGINLFFWEPSYSTQTRFFRRLTPTQKASLTVMAGTFDLDPAALKRAVHGVLRNLGPEQLGLFYLFWVRDIARIGDDTRAVLEQLKQQGDIGDYGLSTHQYALAEAAMNAGWRRLMLRHNIGHRSAETRCLPLAQTLGAEVITFSNLCYGRALSPGELSAHQLYRFSLETPGVASCLTAPTTVEQLVENLEALSTPLSPQTVATMNRVGARLRADDTAFAHCVRWR